MFTYSSNSVSYRDKCQSDSAIDTVFQVLQYPQPSHTWKPLLRAQKRHLRHLAMTENRRGEVILKNLAQELLTDEECLKFKQALQHFRISKSVPSLCTQLKNVITSTDKLILLLELSSRLPKQLQQDFHKLCSIQFPMYEAFLKYFTQGHRNSLRSDPKVIARDESGQFQVISTGFEKQFSFSDLKMCLDSNGADLNSLPGTSMTSGVYSEIDDTSQNGTITKEEAKIFTNIQQVNGFSDDDNSSSVSSPQHSVACNHNDSNLQTLTKQSERKKQSVPKQSVSKPVVQNQSVSKPVVQKQSSVSSHNRVPNGHTLVGGSGTSKPPYSSHHNNVALNVESPSHRIIRRTVLLRRREDGSLGLGIKGGKEYGTSIVVFVVEKDSQAEKQGLKIGDKILEVNGTDFTHLTHAEAVTLMRKAWNVIISIQAADQPYSDTSSSNVQLFDVQVYPVTGRLGCAVHRDTETGEIMVKSVDPHSAASRAGMLVGDSIIQIDGIPVHTMTEKQIATLTNSKRVRIQIRRINADKENVSKKSSRTETISSLSDDVFSPLEKSSPSIDDNKFSFAASTPRNNTAKVNKIDNKEPIETVSSNLANRNTTQRIKWMNEDFDQSDIFQNGGHTNWNDNTTRPQRLYKPRQSQGQGQGQIQSFNQEPGGSIRGSRRYISQIHNSNLSGHSARMTMVYHAKSPADGRASFNERSRSASRHKKSKEENGWHRSQSQSPNTTLRLNSQKSMTAEDRVVLHAVHCGMEKRRHALRLSMYQMPDTDDDDWKI
ncbi:uncharacterized protein LOC121368045 [Gigantopelta aegis]|uniref:uncharacterized protein LOC121368045 n=1 Tax=Gigantopelta aegis TaxID=1735272 RepID=UPI001B88BB33|nr:uncharacterized protein LOC121368045 [Gigantopelta aegis]